MKPEIKEELNRRRRRLGSRNCCSMLILVGGDRDSGDSACSPGADSERCVVHLLLSAAQAGITLIAELTRDDGSIWVWLSVLLYFKVYYSSRLIWRKVV
jgi:hypothetical protein